jgi:hypothetical protein
MLWTTEGKAGLRAPTGSWNLWNQKGTVTPSGKLKVTLFRFAQLLGLSLRRENTVSSLRFDARGAGL